MAPGTSGQGIVFDGAPVITLRKPRLWPGAAGSKTTVHAACSPHGIHTRFTIECRLGDTDTSDPLDKRSVQPDDRIKVFTPACGVRHFFRF